MQRASAFASIVSCATLLYTRVFAALRDQVVRGRAGLGGVRGGCQQGEARLCEGQVRFGGEESGECEAPGERAARLDNAMIFQALFRFGPLK